MANSRRIKTGVLVVISAPIVVLVMIPLAIIAALGFYLFVLIQSVWLLCRALPDRLFSRKIAGPVRAPHFLDAPTPIKEGD